MTDFLEIEYPKGRKNPPAPKGRVDNIVSCAVKLWKYIEKLDENGVDIRCAGKRWMIGDHWNETTEGVGNSLQEAVENLPKHC